MENLGERVLPNEGKPPLDQRSQARRTAIFRAALDVFSRYGFHQASVDEIAKLAGVGKGTIYLYVPDKENLLLEAIIHEITVHEQQLHECIKTKTDTLEKLYELLHMEGQFMLDNVQLAKVLFAERTALGFGSAFQTAMADKRKQRKELIISIMKEGQDRRQLRTDVEPERLALAFLAIGSGAVFDVLFDDGPKIDPKEAARSYLELFLRGASA